MRKVFSIILILVLLTGCQSNETPLVSSFEIDFYSVGNADAALVSCDGHYMMIDCGSDDIEVTDSTNIYKIDRYLQEKEVKHLDFIICSHPDEDHYEGITKIIKGDEQARTFGEIYCSEKPSDDSTREFREFGSEVQTLTKKITVPKVGKKFKLGSANIEILAVNSDNNKTTNDSSIVLMITYGTTKFLFTGDAESTTETYLVNNKDIKCDVLKVAHHGSSTSTSDDFLYEASPKYAVISVGANNPYGHPSDKVVSRLENRGINILNTSNGTIVCTSDGSRV